MISEPLRNVALVAKLADTRAMLDSRLSHGQHEGASNARTLWLQASGRCSACLLIVSACFRTPLGMALLLPPENYCNQLA